LENKKLPPGKKNKKAPENSIRFLGDFELDLSEYLLWDVE